MYVWKWFFIKLRCKRRVVIKKIFPDRKFGRKVKSLFFCTLAFSLSLSVCLVRFDVEMIVGTRADGVTWLRYVQCTSGTVCIRAENKILKKEMNGVKINRNRAVYLFLFFFFLFRFGANRKNILHFATKQTFSTIVETFHWRRHFW